MEVSRQTDSSNEMKPLRKKSVEFLIRSSHQLRASPIVKYSALSLFADRFLPSLTTLIKMRNKIGSWLLRSMEESNLQLFSLISIWISSKIHDSRALSVKCLKSLGDEFIKDQHFTIRDFVEAEVVFLQVASYVVTVPKQQWEFPVLPWVKFVTSYKEEDIVEKVKDILTHVFEPHS
ncbi:hypothetical protein ES332_D12G185500v1 [Gossypium tomentosum]|uniref:Uncharacterized protein n=2 Tax=Gossypium TaxID=3633 RepID=A0A0D2RGS2_GOSRA|nr:hypothetical protein B456_008G169800 [Gossypium raimondii]TYH39528.1 hypothetical protein ES332_D12G185500v1 [Gossypium tomentosum]TYH39533.1 hypothetical protein ES332_D12G185500v1 [Gossypium tomentosum]TYH39539.1 hypothetical protein ES332_D12G185500v1 [Gossypium tomentosum]